MPEPVALRYRELDAAEIVETLERLCNRVRERFPGSGLGGLSSDLLVQARGIIDRLGYLRRPHWPIRIGVGIAIVVMVVVLGTAFMTVRVQTRVSGIAELMQALDASISMLAALGATVFFLITLENRIKRSRALAVIHQLRSLAHIVDMHQLTKDPEVLMAERPATSSSPARTMSAPDLGRYLDYCTELLSIISKVAALLAQDYNDPVVLEAVNDIEGLAGGLSGKIWQKITLLERVTVRPAAQG